MRKRLLSCVIIIILILCGCQNSSDQFLSYEDTNTSEGYDIGNYLNTQSNDFFSKDLVTISTDDTSDSDPVLTSLATLSVNVTDKEVIYQNNVYEELFPASLTKLMTALVVLKNAELTDSVTISYNASHIQESGAKTCGFSEGDVLSLDSLLYCLLIYSGNDAGIAIAEHVGGSEESFIKMMNAEAADIGATDSNFKNSHGLHDDLHYTTAYDLYLIFNELLQYDKFLSIIGMSSYTADYHDSTGNEQQKVFETTNWYFHGNEEAPEGITVLGAKTGTTYKAGNCLILLSQDTENKRYISIILKADSSDTLYSQMSHLLSKTIGN